MSDSSSEEQSESRNEGFNSRHRGESPEQSLDRNWMSLLQELRVVQTGVQLLTGFLLILPFQNKFAELPAYDKVIYMVAVLASVTATILLTSPVGMHRMLFRRRALADLVSAAHRAAMAGLILLGVTLTCVVVLITDVVVGPEAAVTAGVAAVATFFGVWVMYPLLLRRRIASSP
ncbi:sodium:proton antiporter [Rhodococcus sp. EPR-157]|uniref:DUF6328 family protein n=1 Tax=Rhodococcus sp. EPR-157 TaxID=1813677 RepID=UPI0007BB40E0|nr:DUF6328 family protein [Rhodococcus sp. EPR-157]KZF09193.1 sodium:proton antiporter [Rhodococcus sp. EPR-157]